MEAPPCIYNYIYRVYYICAQPLNAFDSFSLFHEYFSVYSNVCCPKWWFRSQNSVNSSG